MPKETDEDIVREAKERFDRGKEWEAVARVNFIDDMKFANGDSVNMWQWPSSVAASRQSRPCLTINKARVHNLQVVNDARQNKAAIRISPIGDEATYDAAKIFEGVCRHIEYISQATQAYDTATYNQVYGGIGYWRILTDYAHDNTTEQEVFIRRVPDPLSIYLDSDIQQYDGSDAKWGLIFYDMTKEEFKAAYPRHAESGADPVGDHPIGNTDGWNDDEHTRVAEYYRVGEKTDTLHMMPDGSHIRESALPEGGMETLAKAGVVPLRSREISEPEVEWFLIGGDTILDRKPWPGRYIPIVRVPCEETVIENKLDRVSHTRHLRDAQRAYNYYASQAAEFVGLQGKSPFIAPAAAIEGRQGAWETANTENHSVMTYNQFDDMGREIRAPERSQPPVMAQAYLEGMKVAQEEMMLASGQYQAVMGEPSNETSGKAINARQRQGDNATYHVIDHLAGAIRFTGRILIDLIPKIYDTERVITIMAENGDQSQIHIDPRAPAAHQTVPDPTAGPPSPNPQGQADPAQAQSDAVKTIWNPKVGRYDVIAEVGPAYATRREEAFNAYSQILAQNKEWAAIVGDLMMKAADFPGADEMAERLRNMVPPQALGGPSQQVMQLQQQLQATHANGQAIAQKADAEVARLKAELVMAQEKLKDRSAGTSIDDYRAETDRLKAVAAADPGAAQVLIRSMLSQLLGMPALPIMHEHQAADAANAQAIAPPDPAMMNGAGSAAGAEQ